MIVSHKYKFVFVHIPKTGGTSLHYSLKPLLGEDDISADNPPWEGNIWKHLKARELKTIYEKRGWNWDEYFKFAFVRNPWDRAHSDYHYSIEMAKENARKGTLPKEYNNPQTPWLNKLKWVHGANPSFEEFLKRCLPLTDATTFKLYCRDGKGNDLVDFVGRYENLERDFAYILGRIGADLKNIMKVNVTKKRPPMIEDYTDRLIEYVWKVEKYDIERFGYDIPK